MIPVSLQQAIQSIIRALRELGHRSDEELDRIRAELEGGPVGPFVEPLLSLQENGQPADEEQAREVEPSLRQLLARTEVFEAYRRLINSFRAILSRRKSFLERECKVPPGETAAFVARLSDQKVEERFYRGERETKRRQAEQKVLNFLAETRKVRRSEGQRQLGDLSEEQFQALAQQANDFYLRKKARRYLQIDQYSDALLHYFRGPTPAEWFDGLTPEDLRKLLDDFTFARPKGELRPDHLVDEGGNDTLPLMELVQHLGQALEDIVAALRDPEKRLKRCGEQILDIILRTPGTPEQITEEVQKVLPKSADAQEAREKLDRTFKVVLNTIRERIQKNKEDNN